MIEPLQRHDLVRVDVNGWQRALASRPDLASRAHVADWAHLGWPVMMRRYLPDDVPGLLPVAISLPPVAGKSGVSLQLNAADICGRVPAVMLRECVALAPQTWRGTLESVCKLGQRFDTVPFVFGSLLWQSLTGMTYLSERSDVDLIWPVTRHSQAISLAHALSICAREAPMRLDGEFVLPQGEAVHWREFYDGADEVIVKSMHRVESRAFSALFAA